MTIQDHVTRLAEPDHQFAQPRSSFKRPADLRHGFQEQELPLDQGPGAGSGTRIPSSQEAPAPFEASNRACRHDHPWHGGAS